MVSVMSYLCVHRANKAQIQVQAGNREHFANRTDDITSDHIRSHQIRSDPHLMIYMFRGRYIPDLYDLHDTDHVIVCLLRWVLYGTALAYYY